MNLFIKEVLNNKLSINYIIVFLIITLIMMVSIYMKNFFRNLINKNYYGSYIYIKLDDEKIIEDKYIKDYIKCIKINEEIYVEKNINGISFEKTIINDNNFKNEYILILKDWKKINKIQKKMEKEKIRNDIFINKKSELKIDKYYDYINVFIYLIMIIINIVQIITINNLISDYKKINKIYMYLGFNKKKIHYITFIKVLSLLLFPSIIFILFLIIYNLSYFYSFCILVICYLLYISLDIYIVEKR